MTAEKSEMRLQEAEQSAAITCLRAELKVAQSDLQRAQSDASRAAAAAAAAKSAADAELAAVRDKADASAAEVSRLSGVVDGLQQQLQAAHAAAEKAAGEVSAHLATLAGAEARCQRLEDDTAQQVRAFPCLSLQTQRAHACCPAHSATCVC